MVDFYDQRHASSRLDGTVILFNGKPINVHSVEGANRAGRFRINYVELGDDVMKTEFFPHEGFDFTPVPLGFMQYTRGGVLNMSRIPSRQWKLGLCRSNLHMATHRLLTSPDIRRDHRLMSSHDLKRCILGEYKPYSDARARTKRSHYSTAFSRNFAVAQDNILFHRMHGSVGECKPGAPELAEDFMFLKESLEEILT